MLLYQSWDESHSHEANCTNSDIASMISEVTAPMQVTPTTAPLANSSNATPGSLVHQMICNARTNNNQSSHSEISIIGQYYTPMGHSVQIAITYTITNMY